MYLAIRSFSRSSNMPFGLVRAAEENSSFTSSQPWSPWNCHDNRAFAKLNNPFRILIHSLPLRFYWLQELTVYFNLAKHRTSIASKTFSGSPCFGDLWITLSASQASSLGFNGFVLLAQWNRLRSLCYESILLSRMPATLRFHAVPPPVENRMPGLHCPSSAFALVRGNDKQSAGNVW